MVKQEGEATPWIHVICPHGGGDKGFHFIPEKGEKVMVDFHGSNVWFSSYPNPQPNSIRSTCKVRFSL